MSQSIQVACFKTLANEIAANCSKFKSWNRRKGIVNFLGLKFKYISCGSFRNVFKIYGHEYVVKIAHNYYDGAEANFFEACYWRKTSTATRRLLAKTVAISDDTVVLIMKYVPRKARRKDADRLRALVPKSLRWDCYDKNIRLTSNNSPKLVDYH